MTDIRAWQHAYAVQAKADFAAFTVLRQSYDLPPCLALHCLQMASEKLCKSFLCSQKIEMLVEPVGKTPSRSSRLPPTNYSNGKEPLYAP